MNAPTQICLRVSLTSDFPVHFLNTATIAEKCWYFLTGNVGRECECQRIVTRHRVRSRHGGQLRQHNPPATLSAQGSTPFLQDSDRVGKFWRRIWNLGRRPVRGHRSSSNNATSCAYWCLLAVDPRRAADQLHCLDSSRLVRRPGSSSGSLPGSSHCGNGARVFW